MSNDRKNAYELRTDLLGMAIGILESRNERQESNEHFSYENEPEAYKRKPVNPYTTEDVLIEAEKLYQFVQTK